MALTFILYSIPVACNIRKVPFILNSIKDYIFYSISYVVVFYTYAFCRIDDLSWGTKGLDKANFTDKE